MELRDFIVTPLILFVIYGLAYFIRPKVTDVNTKRYFLPALTVKIIGAIAVGLIYQFYYGGGDTFAYHTHGSRVIWDAFMESPTTGVKLFFNADITDGVYSFAKDIWYYNDAKSFFIIQITTIFDLFTFSTYSATAILFAVFSFSGLWALYLTFYNQYKNSHLLLALSILFVPTVFFWGSGILKDTISLGCLGWMTLAFYRVVIDKKGVLIWGFILLLSGYMIYSVKVYIILSFIPGLFLWFYLSQISNIQSVVARAIIAPFLLVLTLGLGYLAVNSVVADDSRYNLNQIAETARITAYDIRYGWGARFGDGSGYDLGELDGTFASMIKLMPAAINVSLFRPYLWEVKNPLMLLSALESLVFLMITLYVFFKIGPLNFFSGVKNPEVAFCLIFSLTFAFAVGISTYNFGTLSRYKIPMIPFYLSALSIIWHGFKESKFKSQDS